MAIFMRTRCSSLLKN